MEDTLSQLTSTIIASKQCRAGLVRESGIVIIHIITISSLQVVGASSYQRAQSVAYRGVDRSCRRGGVDADGDHQAGLDES